MRKVFFIILIINLLEGCGIFGDFTSPEIISKYPAPDSKNVDKSSDIKIIFSEPMNKAITEKAFALTANNSSIEGYFHWEDGDRSMIFKPMYPLTESSIFYVTIEKDAEDKNGNNLSERVNYKFFVNNEIIKPYLISSYPEYGAMGVSRYTNIIINFSEPMDKSSLISGVSFSPDITYILTLINNGATAVFKPITPLDYGTTYSVSIDSSVKDREGNTLVESYKFIFTVGNDFTYPELMSLRNSSSAINWHSGIINELVEKDDDILLTFSKYINPAGIDSYITFTPSIDGSFIWVSSNIVKFSPEKDFEITRTYSIKISQGIKDINGNESIDEYLYYFRISGTNSIPPHILRISSIDSTNWQNNQAISLNPDRTYTNIKIYFTHPMNQVKVIDNISIEYIAGSGNSGVEINKFLWNSPSDDILRIDLENLDAGNIYMLKIKGGDSGAFDKNNNYLTNDYIIFFKT